MSLPVGGQTSPRPRQRHGKPLAIHIAHNPLTTVPAPRGIYGVDEDEWFATRAPDAPGEFDLSHS